MNKGIYSNNSGHENMVDQIKAGKSPATKHLENPKLVETANKVFLNAKIKDV